MVYYFIIILSRQTINEQAVTRASPKSDEWIRRIRYTGEDIVLMENICDKISDSVN